MFLQWEYVSKTYEEIEGLVRPDSATEPESFPDVFFDTVSYPAAGSGRLTYFNNANAGDATMSNLPDGKLEPDSFFELHRIFTYIMALPEAFAAATVAGTANDLELLHKTARGQLILELGQKRVPAIPLTFLGRAGGADAPGIVGTFTATAGTRWPVQTCNGGFPMNGAIVIPALTQLKAFLEFNSTAISAATNIRLELAGVYHRPVR